MERRDEGLGHDAGRSERDENFTEREQRLADEDRLTRDLERERDDLERNRDIEVTREADVASRGDEPTVGDQIGEAAGGISGVVAGAAIGSLGGPLGTIIGGIAGAVGGWWAGRAISEAASRVTHDDDAHYRSHYESLGARRETTGYDDARPAYHLGHIAGYNPGYAGREFDEIEPELERGWASAAEEGRGDWTGVREYARVAYTRSRGAARDAAWLGQAEAVRTGDSFENATPDLASSAASRPALEGEEISPAMLDYMADNTEGSSANSGLSSTGSSGSFASSTSGSVPADAETPRGTSETASSIEAVSNADSSASQERERVADNDTPMDRAGYAGGVSSPGAGTVDTSSSARVGTEGTTEGNTASGTSEEAERKWNAAASSSSRQNEIPGRSSSSASGGTGAASSGSERPSFNDPAGPNNADRSLSTRPSDEGVFSMDEDRHTRSIGDADEGD